MYWFLKIGLYNVEFLNIR